MSRWIENYSQSEFHTRFISFQELVNSFNIEEVSDSGELFEISRLKKMIVFIESYLKLIEPELNKINFLNEPLSQINKSIDEFNLFNSNKNIEHLYNVNSSLDNCTIHLKNANILLPKISSRSISSMIEKYHSTTEELLNEIDFEYIKESSMQIKNLQNELIDSEESIKNKILNLFDDINIKYEKVNTFYNDILIDETNNISIKSEVLNAKESILKDIENIRETISESSNELDELEKFYIKIYGKLDENKEKRIDGLKQELDNRLTLLTDFEKKQQDKYEALFKEIESLLPSATSVGLAEAYYREREKFSKPIIFWNIVFMVSLVAITIFSFLSLKDLDTIEDIGKSIFHSLPISIPLVWLAIYSSKRRSENQRLEQEYAHKEALAKSYISYKRQIEELKSEDTSLLMRLLDTAIQTISYNASQSLDKKHGDGTILNEILSNVKNNNKKLKDNSNE